MTVDLDRLFATMCAVVDGEVSPGTVYRDKLNALIERVDAAINRVFNVEGNAEQLIGGYVQELKDGKINEEANLAKIKNSINLLDKHRQELSDVVKLGSDQLEVQRAKLKELRDHLDLLRKVASAPKPPDPRLERAGQIVNAQFKQANRRDAYTK